MADVQLGRTEGKTSIVIDALDEVYFFSCSEPRSAQVLPNKYAFSKRAPTSFTHHLPCVVICDKGFALKDMQILKS